MEEEEEKVNVSEENRSTEGTKISKYSAEEGKFLDFESKMIWFNGNLDKERISWKKGADVIVITRDHIIENSMVQIETVNLHKVIKYLKYIYYGSYIYILGTQNWISGRNYG